MATKKKSSAKGAEKPAIRLKKPRNPNPPPPPEEYRFKPGQSGNPSGRPKLLGEAYKEKLKRLVPGDAEGRTYAEVLADAMTFEGLKGNVQAVKEIRSATEGDKVVFEDAWKREVIDLLKAGRLTPQDLIEAVGLDDARSLIIAAGAALPAAAPEPKDTAGGADDTAA